jgi:DNA-binding NtrC family response regulator
MGFFTGFFSTKALFPQVDKAIMADKSILCVAESATMRQVIKMTFEPYNCKIDLLNSGQTAMNALPTMAPDVAIVDSAVGYMPSLDLCRLIKERYPKALLCLIKGLIAKKPNANERGAGVTMIISKPVNSRRLILEVSEFLSDQQKAGA